MRAFRRLCSPITPPRRCYGGAGTKKRAGGRPWPCAICPMSRRSSARRSSERDLPPSTFALIRESAGRYGDRLAFRFIERGLPDDPVRDITYREFFGQVVQAANLFHELGVTPELSVSMLLPLTPETFVSADRRADGGPRQPDQSAARAAADRDPARRGALPRAGRARSRSAAGLLAEGRGDARARAVRQTCAAHRRPARSAQGFVAASFEAECDTPARRPAQFRARHPPRRHRGAVPYRRHDGAAQTRPPYPSWPRAARLRHGGTAGYPCRARRCSTACRSSMSAVRAAQDLRLCATA